MQHPPQTPSLARTATGWLALMLLLLVAPRAHADDWTALHRLESRFRVGERQALLEPLAAVRTPAAARAAASFLEARIRAATGDGPGARRALERADRVRQVAEPAWRFAEVEVLLAEKREEDALARLGELRKRFPKYRWAAADLLFSRLQERHQPPREVAQTALELLKRSQIRLPPDELLDRAIRATATFDVGQANRLRRRLILQQPHSPLAAPALEALGGLAALSRSDRLLRVERLFATRTYEQCRAEALPLWEAGYKPEEVGFYLGKIGSERLRDDYPGAARYLTPAAEPDAPFALAALSSLAIVNMKLGRTDTSVALFDEWLRRYEATTPVKRVVEAYYDRGRALHEGGRSAEAATQLARWLRVHKKGFDWGKYQWFVGFWYYQAKRWDAAIEAMRPLLRRSNPLEGGKARYWTARAYDAKGQRKRAVGLLADLAREMPLTYYAELAERRLTAWDASNRIPRRPRVPPVRPERGLLSGVPQTRLTADLQLGLALGDAHAARWVAERLKPRLRKALGKARSDTVFDALAVPLERYSKARYEAWREHRRGALLEFPSARNIDAWRAVYPRAFGPYVEAAASRHGVPAAMVYAHMLQESRFKPWMISGAPAYGLMELLDRTARRLADQAGDDYQLWMVMEPSWNILWGAQYLGALYRKFHGQLPFAVASYNGGPMLVSYHLAQSSGQDFDLMIDDIGPHETRNYTRRVIEHFLRYAWLYETPTRARELSDVLVPTTWHPRALPWPDY